MRPGWTAGVTRARLLATRAIGPEHAAAIAACTSLSAGVGLVAGSAYGERVGAGVDLVAAQRAVAETLLWHLRILAGWLPATGAGLVRTLAGWFELVNIDARVAALVSDGREPAPFVLGGLSIGWSAIERARTVEEMADAVARTSWGDPGGRTPPALTLGMRVAWARRVDAMAAGAADWVAGASALLVARELLVAGSHDHSEQLQRLPAIGEEALRAGSFDELRAALPARAAWALADVSEADQLWHAELGWWNRVERDANALLPALSEETVVLAAVVLLAVDAHRTVCALQAAAAGGLTAVAGAGQ